MVPHVPFRPSFRFMRYMRSKPYSQDHVVAALLNLLAPFVHIFCELVCATGSPAIRCLQQHACHFVVVHMKMQISMPSPMDTKRCGKRFWRNLKILLRRPCRT